MKDNRYYQYQASARGLMGADDVKRTLADMRGIYDRLLAPQLPPDRQSRIYEVACGPGLVLLYLKELGYPNISGSDNSACQTSLAQALGLPVVTADSLTELRSQRQKSLDCIIAIDFIEHLPKEILMDFLALAHDCLKPGGKLILRAPNGDSPFVGRNLFNDITHFWAYTTVATRALLSLAGFRQVIFAEESQAAIQNHRWIKIPLMSLSQKFLRFAIRSATREQVEFLSPNIFVFAEK
jgi:SAM-dependent methyltransferase